MAIKMRNNKKENAICASCNCSRDEALDMFDVCIGKQIFTLCDQCNEELLRKTLSAECIKNARTKNNHDKAIISKRRASEYIEGPNHMTVSEALKGYKGGKDE